MEKKSLEERLTDALSRFSFKGSLQPSLLPKEERHYFEKHTEVVTLKKKEVLIRQGSFPSGVYFLQKGKLKVYQSNYDGSVQIIFIHGVGEAIGHRPLLSGEYHPMNIAALEDCELLFFEKKHFMKLLQRSISLSNQLLVGLSHEYTVLTNRINVFAQRGIKERLALALLILNEKFLTEKDVDRTANIIISRTDLANFVGTSLENLVRTLSYFKSRHLIRTSGKSIFIKNFETLFILSTIE